MNTCNAFFEIGEQWPPSFFIKLFFMHVYAAKFTLLHLPFSIAFSIATKIWASAMHMICLFTFFVLCNFHRIIDIFNNIGFNFVSSVIKSRNVLAHSSKPLLRRTFRGWVRWALNVSFSAFVLAFLSASEHNKSK